MIAETDKHEYITFEITQSNEGLTIKDFLKKYYEFSSRSIRRLKKGKRIYLNDKPASVKKNTFRGDRLKIYFKKEKLNYKPQEMTLDVLYEDGDILVLNKPPFMVVHPTKTHKEGTLANGIAHYFKEHDIQSKIRFINRLDMNTSGIILIAKNSYGHQYIQKQMERNEIIKKYKAIVTNNFPYDEGSILLPIGKKQKGDVKRKVFNSGKTSLSHFKTISFREDLALVDVQIITGRTHQIRVHFNHHGSPLLGDSLYGEESCLINRQALHSYYVKFKPPRRENYVEIECQLPKDMLKIVKE